MLLLSAPAFHLLFSGFGFGPAPKFLGIEELLRSALACVMPPLASEMFFEASVYIRRYAGIESPISVLRYV